MKIHAVFALLIAGIILALLLMANKVVGVKKCGRAEALFAATIIDAGNISFVWLMTGRA